MPRESEEVVSVATPVLELTEPVPRVLVPSRNSTVPVGEPAVAVTVAVKVTESPVSAGFSEEMSAVVVLVLVTTGEADISFTINVSVAPSGMPDPVGGVLP